SVKRCLSYVCLSFAAAYHLIRAPKRPDLILCAGPVEEMFLVSVYARLRRIPCVLDVFDLWPDLFLHAFPQCGQSLARILLEPYFIMASIAYGIATHVTAVSNTYLEWALRLSGRSDRENFSYYYLGYHNLHCPLEGPSDSDEVITCLFAGQFGFSYDLEL